jgi:BASS family bile acid:Na+ symporter
MIIWHFKEAFALRMAKPVWTASGIVIALVIIGIVLKEKEHFISYFQKAGLVALALNVATMTVGYYSSKLFKIID